MEASPRDSTQDWLLPEQAKPPRIGDLEERIDEAIATAKASEAAVMTVGAAALDAAEQARRAANLAERASAVVFAGRSDIRPMPTPEPKDSARPRSGEEDESLRDFNARADRLAARLRELERSPIAAVG